MMNFLGKFLVVVHVTLSILALTAAAFLLFLSTDWGRTQPRAEAIERVPSELDKRAAAAKLAIDAAKAGPGEAKKAQDYLHKTMDRFAQNHLFYRNRLEELRSGQGPIKAFEVATKDDAVDLVEPNIGRPKETELAGIEKSLEGYRAELKGEDALLKQIDAALVEVRSLIAANEKVTRHLQGLDAAGKKTGVGLYDLLEDEAKMQQQIRFERAYLQPQWAEALEQAQTYAERRAFLEQTLERLKKDFVPKSK